MPTAHLASLQNFGRGFCFRADAEPPLPTAASSRAILEPIGTLRNGQPVLHRTNPSRAPRGCCCAGHVGGPVSEGAPRARAVFPSSGGAPRARAVFPSSGGPTCPAQEHPSRDPTPTWQAPSTTITLKTQGRCFGMLGELSFAAARRLLAARRCPFPANVTPMRPHSLG
jgi:hypothetical protein